MRQDCKCVLLSVCLICPVCALAWFLEVIYNCETSPPPPFHPHTVLVSTLWQSAVWLLIKGAAHLPVLPWVLSLEAHLDLARHFWVITRLMLKIHWCSLSCFVCGFFFFCIDIKCFFFVVNTHDFLIQVQFYLFVTFRQFKYVNCESITLDTILL